MRAELSELVNALKAQIATADDKQQVDELAEELGGIRDTRGELDLEIARLSTSISNLAGR